MLGVTRPLSEQRGISILWSMTDTGPNPWWHFWRFLMSHIAYCDSKLQCSYLLYVLLLTFIRRWFWGFLTLHYSVVPFCRPFSTLCPFWVFVVMFDFFLFWFYGSSRLFHSFWAESIVRWDENGRSPRKTTWPPASRTWLISLGSNLQRWDDERWRAP